MQYHRTGNVRNEVVAPCGCCTLLAVDNSPQIDESEICMGKTPKKKPRKKKDRCPVNGTHEWYKEKKKHELIHRFSFERYRLIKWSEEVIEHTCIHCWKTKVKRIRETYDNSYRMRKRPIPKRTVKF